MEKSELQINTHENIGLLRALYEQLAQVVPFAPSWQGALLLSRYLVSGILATLTHLCIFYVLTWHAGVYYVLASVIGFLLGFGVSFVLQKFWTFQNKSKKEAPMQLVQHLLLQGCMLGVNALGVFLFTEFLGMPKMVSQITIIALIAISSFFIYKFVIFAHKEQTVTDRANEVVTNVESEKEIT